MRHAHEMHAHKIHAHEMHAHEIHAHEMHAHEMHVREVHAHEMHAHGVHAYEGFCEDLARQNIAAHLSQFQLGSSVVTYGVTCCHIWASVIVVVS
jgi:hypothetical protein